VLAVALTLVVGWLVLGVHGPGIAEQPSASPEFLA